MKPVPFAFLLLAIVIGVAGQLLLKLGMTRRPGFRLFDIVHAWRNWPIMAGFGCYGLSTIIYLQVLAQLDLSLAYPTVSLGYVLVIIMSRWLFDEVVTAKRWMAVAIICAGVFMVGLGSK